MRKADATTCRRTYGSPVDVPGRCGGCLTGLSLDGRPVHPVQRADGLWVSPITGAECLRLPDGTWTIYSEMPSLGPWTREQQIERVAAGRAAGIW